MEGLSVFAAAREAPERIAVVSDRTTLTFGALAAAVAACSEAVERARPGPIAFIAQPALETVILMCALFELGRPIIPLHPKWTEAERRSALEGLDEQVTVADPAEIARPEAVAGTASRPAPPPDAVAAVLFTSGSSGRPKGVVLERRALAASARAHAQNLPFEPDDRWLAAMPLAHAGGLSIVIRALASRTAVVLAPRFDASEIAARIAEQRITLASFVPAMLHAVIERGGAAALAALRAILVGGAAFPPALRARARDAGIRALATYGLTETASQIATQAPGDPIALDAARVGRPLAGARIAIRDDRGEPLEPGARGRIWASGPMLMRGYAGAPPLEPGAWLETGDEGSLGPDGALSVFGRADDTIVTGGENVDPIEVEAALGMIAGVREVAIFGVADPVWGQAVAAALVLDAGRDPRAVCDAAAEGLAPFKRPRAVAVLSALPKTASGKIDRRAVAAAAAAALTPIKVPSRPALP